MDEKKEKNIWCFYL